MDQIESMIIEKLDQLQSCENIINDSSYISEDLACRILKRSKTTLWRLRKQGIIPFHKYGGRILYKIDDIEDFINENYISNDK